MTIGVISDLHLSRKTLALERALSRLRDVDLLLVNRRYYRPRGGNPQQENFCEHADSMADLKCIPKSIFPLQKRPTYGKIDTLAQSVKINDNDDRETVAAASP